MGLLKENPPGFPIELFQQAGFPIGFQLSRPIFFPRLDQNGFFFVRFRLVCKY
jgi:hypothetical protein